MSRGPARPTDIADINYTSGTTGGKGEMMNHQHTLRLYTELCELADLREGDRYLIVNPFFHTSATGRCISSLIRGATILRSGVHVPKVDEQIETGESPCCRPPTL